MGVPAFFAWLMRKYPDALTDLPSSSSSDLDGSATCRRRRGESSSARCRRVEAKQTEEGQQREEDLVAEGQLEQEEEEEGSEAGAGAEDQLLAAWRCDNLYLDMNGIIHPCCHPEGGQPQPASEAEMFDNVAELLDNLVTTLRPAKVLYLAIDGVAPRAKMNQQRARRFRSQADAKESREAEQRLRAKMQAEGIAVPPPKPPSWDHNVITPGTKFMADLAEYLRNLTAQRVASHPAWKHLAVILSDSSVPGEGEHKLLEFVRRSQGQASYDPNARHCIVGDDADLIMLALATHELHFTIVRTRRFLDRAAFVAAAALAVAEQEAQLLDGAKAPEQEADEGGISQWQLLHVSVLREHLRQEFAEHLTGTKPQRAAQFERLVDYFVFLCFFVGNDFLPHLPSLDIREGALDLLLQLYKRAVLSPPLAAATAPLPPGEEGAAAAAALTQFAWTPHWLTSAGEVDFAAVYPLIGRLGEVEVAILERRRQKAARESKPKNQVRTSMSTGTGLYGRRPSTYQTRAY